MIKFEGLIHTEYRRTKVYDLEGKVSHVTHCWSGTDSEELVLIQAMLFRTRPSGLRKFALFAPVAGGPGKVCAIQAMRESPEDVCKRTGRTEEELKQQLSGEVMARLGMHVPPSRMQLPAWIHYPMDDEAPPKTRVLEPAFLVSASPQLQGIGTVTNPP